MSDREVVRCRNCRLNQFMTRLKHCRRCRKSLIEVEPIAPPETSPVVSSPTPMSACFSYDLATAIRLLRHAAGLSQREVALRMKTARTRVSKLEARIYPAMTMATIQGIAEALETTPYHLMRFARLCAEAKIPMKAEVIAGARLAAPQS